MTLNRNRQETVRLAIIAVSVLFFTCQAWALPILTQSSVYGGFYFLEKGTVPPTPGANLVILYAKDKAGVSNLYFKNDAGTVVDLSAVGGGATWGSITGTLTDQTDLDTALDGKSDLAHTHTGTTISALDAGDVTTGTFLDALVDGSLEADELTLVGDVDGAANANDLDEVAVETELEAVMDLPDLQGILTAAKGGTGDDTSVATGVPQVTAGNWTYDAGMGDLADDLTCSGSQVVRRNAGDTAWECATVGVPGGSTNYVQYNAGGTFGGISTFRFNGTELTVGGAFEAASTMNLYGSGFAFEGGTVDANEMSLTVEDPTADVSLLLINRPAGTYDILAADSNGFVARTAASTQAVRSIAAGTGIGVANGDGGSGNPTVSLNAGISNLNASTSADLRGVLSDEVGTGAAMFGLISTMADELGCTGSQVVRRNAGDTAFECATPASGSGYDRIQEEGSNLTQRATVNFIGSSITCVDDGASKTNCTVSSGAGNFVEVSLTLGNAGYYSTTVTGQAWVTGTSVIVCSPFGTTADGGTPELAAVADLQSTVANRSAGVGFDLMVYNPHGASGTYRFHCTGA